MSIRRCVGWFALALSALTLGLTPTLAHAQLAPTGAHYGAKASDTGHDLVGPNENGDFIASVPLDLPSARGGLPVPLQIVSGKRGFGAAGVGWDIPLSYVLVDNSFAHRRPAYRPAGPIVSRDHIVVALPGLQAEMVPIDATHWIARNSPQLSMTFDSSGYKVFDANGLTYNFVMKPEVATAGIGLWLLDSIVGAGNASLKVNYSLALEPVSGSQTQTLAIDLAEIDYNPHPTGSCYKTKVVLGYEQLASGAAVQSLSVLGPAVLERKHKLDSVDVKSVASCSDSTYQVLSHYSLQYQLDPDTGLQRLAGVTVSGREGTPEQNKNIAVAGYSYGAATSVDGSGNRTLQYASSQSHIPFPNGSQGLLAGTAVVGGAIFQAPIAGVAYGTLASFTDFTGDGRPDLVFQDSTGNLQIARNQPTPGNAATFTAVAPFTDTTFKKQVLDAHTASVARFASTAVDKATEWNNAVLQPGWLARRFDPWPRPAGLLDGA